MWVAIGKGSNDATITIVAYSADGFKWKKVTSTITDLDGGPNTMFNASDDMFLAEFVVVARD